MNFPFTVAHQTAGRTRIHWTGDRDQRACVTQIAGTIGELDGVQHSDPRPLTGSIVISHPERPWQELMPELEEEAAITFTTAPHSRSGLESVSLSARRFDEILDESGVTGIDIKNFSFLLLLVLAVIQAARGQVMVSSISLLWYAIDLARHTPAE